MIARSLLTTLLVVLVAAVSIQAQGQLPGVTGFGIKAGFGLGTVGTTMDEMNDLDSFAGAAIGGFLIYGLTPRLSVRTELQVAAKGAGGGLFRGRSFRHDYLEIPVLLNYHLALDRSLRPSLYLGPAVAFLLSAEFKSSILSETMDPGDAASSLDFGLAFGGAVGYKRLELDVRYTLGLVNVYDPAEWNRELDAQDPGDLFHMTPDDTIKNRFLSFTLGYRF